jgi:peptide/nickel transport system ATP-binding protein
VTELTCVEATRCGGGPAVDPAPLLVVENLRTTFHAGRDDVRAVDGVSFSARAAETVGIVGESGSGKSVLVRTIMGLHGNDATTTVSGRVTFAGRDLTTMTPAERRRLWGTEIAMVFQDPKTSLNPVKTIGSHLCEPLRIRRGLGRRAARAHAVELLGLVGISEPSRRLRQYPHELSGGMRQRVCLALALTCEPKLLIADEPTTALDVTVQRQILDLLEGIARERGMATLLITHDLGIVARRAALIIVMYAGRIVESQATRALFRAPRHPYTAALMASAPRLADPPHTRLAAIEGRPPNLARLGAGCAFAPRCRFRQAACLDASPPLRQVGGTDAAVACHFPLVRDAAR